jgi:hypothetical protein
MATKYTQWPQNIPNGHKIYPMVAIRPNSRKYVDQAATKYTNIFPIKFTQIGIFGLKICHLATLALPIRGPTPGN